MSVECQHCGSPDELFLCRRCIGQLRDWLSPDRLPWLIEQVGVTAVGQGRLGEGGVRGHRAGLETYADPKPAMDDKGGTEGQRRLERDLRDGRMRARLLAQGGVNAHASDLLDEVTNMLGSWVRDVCERRAVDVPALSSPASMCAWLHPNVTCLAMADCAGETYADVADAMRQCERAINRRPEPRLCGPCPTLGRHTDDGFVVDDQMRSECATRLYAPPAAITVTCPTCHLTYKVDEVVARTYDTADDKSFTIRDLVGTILPKLDMAVGEGKVGDMRLRRALHAEGVQPTGYVVDKLSRRQTARYRLRDVRTVAAVIAKSRSRAA